jgi:hypothetical protein
MGEAWFVHDGLTTIFSYAEMAERYKITTDSEVENAFIVHLPDKKVKFEKNEKSIHLYPKERKECSAAFKCGRE